MLYNSVLDLVGNTPIVRLHSFPTKHRLWAKVEYFNPGLSVKDRVAVAIVEAAEKRGDLKPGGVIVEASSGNTGLGLALVAAVRGYSCIIVMPDKISEEKRAILRAHGAKVVITPTQVEPEDPRSYYSVSQRIARETPNSFYANQYHNKDNPECHYRTTAPEIWNDMKGQIDAIVLGAGTGGSISGIARYLKGQKPDIQVICADPVGSILSDLFHGQPANPQPYLVEGVGEDILPSNMDLDIVDDFIKVTDKEAFSITRQLVAKEGLCVGPSSGLALIGALKYGEKAGGSDKDILTLFPDNGRSYLSKVFNDEWMKQQGMLDEVDEGGSK